MNDPDECLSRVHKNKYHLNPGSTITKIFRGLEFKVTVAISRPQQGFLFKVHLFQFGFAFGQHKERFHLSAFDFASFRSCAAALARITCNARTRYNTSESGIFAGRPSGLPDTPGLNRILARIHIAVNHGHYGTISNANARTPPSPQSMSQCCANIQRSHSQTLCARIFLWRWRTGCGTFCRCM